MRSFLFVLFMGFLVSGNVMARAADVDPPALQASVQQAAERFAQAFRERDVPKLAALFTPEAEYVDSTGVIFHGRDAIAAEYAANFESNPPGELEIEILSIRPVTSGVVVEDGLSTFRPTTGDLSAPIRYTATHVQQADGNWLLASVRELDVPALAPRDRLKALSWLEGAWSEEVGGTTVATEWKWSEDGNFLISEFSVRDLSGVSLKGTQRVGWDGERRQFRSWVFDSTGGSADGWWTAGEEGFWSIQLSGVDAEGKRLSSVLTYSHDGADGLVVTQDQRTLAGNPLPSITHRIVRQPPAPAVQAVP